MALSLCENCGGNGTDIHGICSKCGGFGFALEAKPISREEKIFTLKRSSASFEEFKTKLTKAFGEKFAISFGLDLWRPQRMIL